MAENSYKKTAIIGAGASGLIAALSAAESGKEIVLFEKQERVGRKLMQTGNGRCNISNENAGHGHYYGNTAAEKLIERFGCSETLRFFEKNGLFTRREYGGRYFPYSGQAGTVVDALRFAVMSKKNVELRLESRVEKLLRAGNKGFYIVSGGKKEYFDAVIICTGGPAAEKLGGCTDGQAMLSALGHKVSKLRPALVPLVTDNSYTKALKGIRIEAKAAFCAGERVLRENTGDVLFTDYGLSGPAIMDISRYFTGNGREKVVLDMAPDFSEEQIASELKKMRKIRKTAGELASGFLQNRLSQMIVKYAGIAPSKDAAEVTDEETEAVARAVKSFSFEVKGTMGMAMAQVTRGGAELSGFDPETLESKTVSGLFAAGEVLNADGECGGFNLQWAWTSGYIAGKLGGELNA